jgi:hypothetical protein
MTSQPTHNIKILRLQNGEDLISDCVMSEDDYLVQLNNPMTLIFKRTMKGTVMMMLPWLPIEVISDNIATITQDDILTFADPKDDLIEYYGNMVEQAAEAVAKNDVVLNTLKEELQYMRDEALEELEPDPQEGIKLKNILNELDAQRRKKLH